MITCPAHREPSRMRAEKRQKDHEDKQKSERREDPRLLALKTEEVSSGMWAASETRESRK